MVGKGKVGEGCFRVEVAPVPRRAVGQYAYGSVSTLGPRTAPVFPLRWCTSTLTLSPPLYRPLQPPSPDCIPPGGAHRLQHPRRIGHAGQPAERPAPEPVCAARAQEPDRSDRQGEPSQPTRTHAHTRAPVHPPTDQHSPTHPHAHPHPPTHFSRARSTPPLRPRAPHEPRRNGRLGERAHAATPLPTLFPHSTLTPPRSHTDQASTSPSALPNAYLHIVMASSSPPTHIHTVQRSPV